MRRPIRAPSSRAYQVIHGAPARPVAPSWSTSRSAAHSRRCTLPPRGWSPGVSPRSSSRAPAAASTIRPGGVTKTSQPARIVHQGTVGSHAASNTSAATFVAASSQTSQRGAASPRSSVIATIWPAWVLIGVGGTARSVTLSPPAASDST